jgi:hypothetical protein
MLRQLPRHPAAEPTTPIIEVQADIGDRIAAIKFLADSQGAWKSLLELIENSIDEYPEGYRTRRVINVKVARQGPRSYLRIEDFGRGFVPDREGNPDFRGVVTRVANSMKKSLEDYREAQGEFAVGLFGFRTIGNEIGIVTRTAYKGYPHLGRAYGIPGRGLSRTWDMRMRSDTLRAAIRPARGERREAGTTVTIRGLLNPRIWTGARIKKAVEEELWGRLLEKDLTVRIEDKRRLFEVKPKQRVFAGAHFPRTSVETRGSGPVLLDLYITSGEEDEAAIPVLRAKTREAGATRVYDDITEIDEFKVPPWSLRRVQGWVRFDAARLSGPTRREFTHDQAFHAFVKALQTIEPDLQSMIAAQDVERQRMEVEALRERLKDDLQRVLVELPHLDVFRLIRESVTDGRPLPGLNGRAGDVTAAKVQTILTAADQARARAEKHHRALQPNQGLPDPEFVAGGSRAWRSRYDPLGHAVVVNKSHPDYERESVTQRRWYRYILKLYTKELVLLSFPTSREGPRLLETAIQAQLRAEENL